MADLLDLAKKGKVTDFEKEWANKNGKSYPLNSVDGQSCKAEYDRLRSYNTGAPERQSSKLAFSATAGLSGISDVFSSTTRFGEVSSREEFSTGDFMKTIMTGGLGGFKDKIFGTAELVLEEIGKQLEIESQLRTDINEKTGMAGKLSQAYRDTILDTLPSVNRLGYGIRDLTEFQENLIGKSGRFNMVSRETMIKAAETSRAFVGSMSDMSDTISTFETIGVGATDALNQINKAGKASLEVGLNGRATVKDIRENIGKLNEYGFKNGIQGLAEMSRKAKEFRMDMGEVFKIADKVMSPEGAIDLAANLQVLGGAIGDFGDPLKMMYDATNNVEGLQDALIGAAGSLASYNSESGRFEITGVNLRRAKEMATQLGISYQELAKGAIASQERMAASSELMARGLDLPEKDKEFLTNLSRMEGGKMSIMVPESIATKLGVPTQIALDQLDQKTATALLENKKDFEKMSTEDIARDQFEAVKNIEHDLNAYLTTQRRDLTKTARSEKGFGFDKSMSEVERAFREEVNRVVKQQGGEGAVLKNVNFDKLFSENQNNIVLKGVQGAVGMMTDWIKSNLKVPPTPTQPPTSTPPSQSNINLNITSDVSSDIMARNLLRSDQVWQDIFTRNPRDYTTIGL